jgi:hypothetical protein
MAKKNRKEKNRKREKRKGKKKRIKNKNGVMDLREELRTFVVKLKCSPLL